MGRNDPVQNFLSDPKGLEYFFNPSSVALVGATEKEHSVGRTILSNLISSPFKGKIYPINPKYKELLGIPCFPSIGACGPVDLAVIVTPSSAVPALVKDCVAHGVKAIIIISAGFKELGEAGLKLEQEVLDNIRGTGIRIIGPNCLGLMSPASALNATFAAGMALPGHIAFISQSGALCTSVLDWSLQEKIGFSGFVSIGSMSDVNFGDLIEYFGKDPHTNSILIYMETVGDARSFLSAAKKVALTKPIIIIKPGKTQAAAKAAASHTGSLAGSDEVLEAALERVGVLRVSTISQLFDIAAALAKQPRPKGPNLTIITNAGGPSVLATDKAVSTGAQMTVLPEKTIELLSTFLPSAWSHANPVDILGDAGPATYAKTIELIAQDPATDGMLVILTPQDMTDPTKTADAIIPYAKMDKPLLASWMGGHTVEKGYEKLNNAGIPCYQYPDQAAEVFAMMYRHEEELKALYETPIERPSFKHENDIASLFAQVYKEKRTLLTEFESKKILEAYGIPTVKTVLAHTEEEAAKAAEKMGYPIVVKLHSETITHKSDVGGVKLNLKSKEAVIEAYRSILASVTKLHGKEHFQGVTVQQMISLEGYELILGSKVDIQFGPIIVFGTGGQLVEVYKDSAIGLPPLNSTLAQKMMKKTKIYEALKGVRGRAPVPMDKLEQLLIQFSRLIAEQPLISECDINPILASDKQLIALDARIVLHEPSAIIPKLAIRPYPQVYEEKKSLKEGSKVHLRPIKPEDEGKMLEFHKMLSEKSVYQNFFEFLSYNERTAHNRLIQICAIDYDRDIRFVAETESHKIVGVASLVRIPNTKEGDLKITILDTYHGKGLGSVLLDKLILTAKEEGFSAIRGKVLNENSALIHMLKKRGFSLHSEGPFFLLHCTLS